MTGMSHDESGSDHPAEVDKHHDAHAVPADPGPTGTGGYHPHESPLAMLIPLIVLSIGAVFAGAVFNGYFVGAATGGQILERRWSCSTAT